jgi:valyl-tRNA synthetase
MANAYDPVQVESNWYDYWLKMGYFTPNNTDKNTYVIPIPPPNVTGSLHLGHALTNSIQDCMVRWYIIILYSNLIIGTECMARTLCSSLDLTTLVSLPKSSSKRNS